MWQRELRDMCHHRGALQRIGLAEWIIGVVDVILRGYNIDAARQQFLDASTAAALRFMIEPGRTDQIDVRIDRYSDARGRHHINDFCRVDIIISGHRAAMAGSNAALKSFAHSFYGEIFEAA